MKYHTYEAFLAIVLPSQKTVEKAVRINLHLLHYWLYTRKVKVRLVLCTTAAKPGRDEVVGVQVLAHRGADTAALVV